MDLTFKIFSASCHTEYVRLVTSSFKVLLWILRWWKKVMLTTTLLDAANETSVIPMLLVSGCRDDIIMICSLQLGLITEILSTRDDVGEDSRFLRYYTCYKRCSFLHRLNRGQMFWMLSFSSLIPFHMIALVVLLCLIRTSWTSWWIRKVYEGKSGYVFNV